MTNQQAINKVTNILKSMQDSKSLKQVEMEELMQALGFHHLDSRARWKLKLCDTIMVTDAQLTSANEHEELPDFLTRYIVASIMSKDKLLRKKKILLAFFK